MAEEFVDVNVLDRQWSFGASWWYRKAELGEIPSYKIGKYRRFKLSEVQAWLESHREGPK